ncbi:MAG: NAD-binding protein [Desulfuromonadales bacterium]
MTEKSISTYSTIGRWSRRYSWWFVIALLVIAVLALIGGIAAVFFGTSEQQKTLFKIAKFLGAGGTALGSIQAFWKEICEKYALIRLHQSRGHVVICGLGEKGMRLVEEYIKREKRVVVIESKKDHPDISGCRERGATVIIGDSGDPVILEEANITCARYLFAVTGSDHDNIEITHQAQELVSKADDNKSNLRCFTHIASPSLRDIFAGHDLYKKQGTAFDASIFNVYETASRVMFEKYPPDKYAIEQGFTGDTLRIAVIGFGRTGEAVVKQAARVGHYVDWKNLEITVLDRNIKPVSEKFFALYGDGKNPPGLIVSDVQVRFVDRDPECISSLADIMGTADHAPVIVYVAVDDDPLGLSLAQRVRTLLGNDNTPIVVNMKSQLSKLVSGGNTSPANIETYGFNILDIGTGYQVLHDEVTDELAKAIHQAYSGGAPWEELDETMRDANRWPADHVSVKLRALRCEDNPGDTLAKFCNQDDAIETLSELENRRWKAERFMSGWRYAAVTDKPRKLHNLLSSTPYSELPEDEKNKDRDMVKNLKKLVDSEAWKMHREFIDKV